jgi:hypothetical protein
VPVEFDDTRRSAARLPLSLPIVLKGDDTGGNSFVEHTRTILVNKGGLKTITRQAVVLGGRLQIAVPSRQRVSWASIAWLGEKKGGQQEVGIALDEPDDFWGIQFPPDSLSEPLPEMSAPASTDGFPRSSDGASAEATPGASLDPRPGDEHFSEGGKRDSRAFSTPDKLSGALREVAESAIREALQRALEGLRLQLDELQSQTTSQIVSEIEARMQRSLEESVEQLEARAAEITAHCRETWQERLDSIENAGSERMKAIAAEQEQLLATGAARFRQDLADSLSRAGSALR